MKQEQLNQFTYKIVAEIDGQQITGVTSKMPEPGNPVNVWFPFKKDLRLVTPEMILLTIGKISFHANLHPANKNELPNL